jgi:hypothetical protein
VWVGGKNPKKKYQLIFFLSLSSPSTNRINKELEKAFLAFDETMWWFFLEERYTNKKSKAKDRIGGKKAQRS